jgi:hypothetical protein
MTLYVQTFTIKTFSSKLRVYVCVCVCERERIKRNILSRNSYYVHLDCNSELVNIKSIILLLLLYRLFRRYLPISLVTEYIYPVNSQCEPSQPPRVTTKQL